MFGLNPALAAWMRRPGSPGVIVPGLSVLFSTLSVLAMTMSDAARHVAPLKWYLLATFTAGEALSVGFLSSFYKFQTVMSSMLATALATSAVSIYTARQQNPQYDLTQWGAGLSTCGFVFLGLSLIQLLQVMGIIPASFMPISDALLALAGSCLFSFYLAYHTKLITAGKHSKYRLSEKDYIFGAGKSSLVHFGCLQPKARSCLICFGDISIQ